MKKLDIDFRKNRARFPWSGPVLLAVAVAFAGDVAFSTVKTYQAVRKNEKALARQDTRGHDVNTARRAASPEEVAAARETVQRLGTPWANLFKAIESAASEQVALTAVEPDPKSGTVVISGDSKDYLAALTYVLNLSQAGGLSRVQLVRHEVKKNEPNSPIAFSISATWTKGNS